MTHQPTRSVNEILAELDVRDLTVEFHAIARRHTCTLAEVIGPRREMAICDARFEIWYELHERGWNYSRIGRLFNRDHSTVASGVRQHLRRLCRDAARGAA
jgi:chromosomal replication initiation ATPase DnaA